MQGSFAQSGFFGCAHRVGVAQTLFNERSACIKWETFRRNKCHLQLRGPTSVGGVSSLPKRLASAQIVV